MKTEILGVRFDNLTMAEAEAAALSLLDERRGAYVVTPNPEILLECRRDPDCARAVNGAALVLPDGIGDLYAARILGTPLRERVCGADLVPRLLAALAARGGSVFLYGARPGVADAAAQKLAARYPGLTIAGTENGFVADDGSLLARLRETGPDLLLVGLGAPKQELWMERHAGLEGLGLMIGVGGCLDVFAGTVRRAPAAWQRLGLEWLWRLLREPRRLGRMARLPGVLLLALGERRKKTGTP